MFQLKQLCMQEEGGEGGNGGGGQGPEITPEVQKLIDDAVGAAVGGLKSKNAELLGKLKDTGDKLKTFDGIDPDAVRGILAKFANDEEAQLVAKGDIESVLAKRAERMKSGFEKELQASRESEQRANSRSDKFSALVLDAAVMKAASEAGVHKYAMEDVMLAALKDFDLDDDGNPVAKEGRFGKDGKPLALKEWVAEKKDTRPHWFPATGNGGGAGHGGANGAKTMTQAAFDALPAKQRAAVMAAGTVISG